MYGCMIFLKNKYSKNNSPSAGLGGMNCSFIHNNAVCVVWTLPNNKFEHIYKNVS